MTTHYKDKTNPRPWAVCGHSGLKLKTTEDAEKVDCKNCIKYIKNLDKED
jgi:hypothetical protein